MENYIWITGATSGIGKETVKAFLNNGYNIIASGRNESKLLAMSKELTNCKGKLAIAICEVDKLSGIKLAYEGFAGKYQIECLINNAGITSFKPFEQNTSDEIESIINTNLFGAIYTTQTVLPDMIKQGRGTIINIISVITEKVFENSSLYSASKSGLMAFANVLREEVRKHNIRVINILPGATDTKIWPKEIRRENSKRMMKPAEIADLIVFAYRQKGKMVLENITMKPIKGDI
jgi:short-subunit dehydrogenase